MQRVKITISIVAGCCVAILLLGSGGRTKKYADKLSIGLADEKEFVTDARVFFIGNISLTVTYNCSNSLQIWGKGVPTFIKIQPIFYDQSKDALYLGAPEPIHFSELDWTNLIF